MMTCRLVVCDSLSVGSLIPENQCSARHLRLPIRTTAGLCARIYLNMLNNQLTYDSLKIIGFDFPLMQALGAEMVFTQQLAHANKIVQGLFVARKWK